MGCIPNSRPAEATWWNPEWQLVYPLALLKAKASGEVLWPCCEVRPLGVLEVEGSSAYFKGKMAVLFKQHGRGEGRGARRVEAALAVSPSESHVGYSQGSGQRSCGLMNCWKLAFQAPVTASGSVQGVRTQGQTRMLTWQASWRGSVLLCLPCKPPLLGTHQSCEAESWVDSGVPGVMCLGFY